MMNEPRIQHFLKKNAELISDVEYLELVKDYFQVDKSSFEKGYNPNPNRGVGIWDIKKVDTFWTLIRKYAMPRGKKLGMYDFAGFVFPKFQPITMHDPASDSLNFRNFWEAEEKNIFDIEVSFNDARFMDKTMLAHTVFMKSVYFMKTRLLDFADFYGAVFNGEVFFNDTHFEGESSFLYTIFEAITLFKKSRFSKRIEFIETNFKGTTMFNLASFNDVLFEDLLGFPKLIFRKSSFLGHTIFRRSNLHQISLEQTDVVDVQFRECEWSGGHRIMLQNEYKKGTFADLESTYRQLKRNFDRNKNWELSGKAYVSEMEMRKERLWDDGAYYHWFIYWFYGYFGGYTQNIKKPIVSLFCLIVVFSCIYLFIDGNPLHALQRGIKGALPYVTTDIGVRGEEVLFEGYWLIPKNMELILGGTFLSFFILALRKRFKQ